MSEWIDIADERPNDLETVLVCDMHGEFVTLGEYFESEDLFVLRLVDGLDPDSYPTHWMKLPEPARMEQ